MLHVSARTALTPLKTHINFATMVKKHNMPVAIAWPLAVSEAVSFQPVKSSSHSLKIKNANSTNWPTEVSGTVL